MTSPREPIGVSMIVCDAIYRDPWKNRRTLLGIFPGVEGATYPLHVPRMAVYVVLSECLGDYSFTLRIVDETEGSEPIDEYLTEAQCSDPLQPIEIDFVLEPFDSPRAGDYFFQLRLNGVTLIERRVTFQ